MNKSTRLEKLAMNGYTGKILRVDLSAKKDPVNPVILSKSSFKRVSK